MSESTLDRQLAAALQSRDERLIRRRLPDPTAEERLIDFNSNDYLSLSRSPVLRDLFLSKLRIAPCILGSGGSRLLVNGTAHCALEARLQKFFGVEAAVLFNSGFDANVGLFSCLPQPGDAIIYDEFIHASVYDGIRASRVREAQYAFRNNSVSSLRNLLKKLLHTRPGLEAGKSSVFVAVEALYSMDGTFAPLEEIVDMVEELLPRGNGYVIVDEAHCTGIYGPQGRGLTALLGLEGRVLARLHTFGKALASSGAVILTSTLIKDYMLNYARSLIYTTSLNYANIISVDASFDLLENGTTGVLADKLLDLVTYAVNSLRLNFKAVPSDILSLPSYLQNPAPESRLSPIIPIMTNQPRPLSSYIIGRGINARPITWPTVPKGQDRLRICLHAGNTREEVDQLLACMLKWADAVMAERQRLEKEIRRPGNAAHLLLESKL